MSVPRLGTAAIRRLSALHRKIARAEGWTLPSTGGGVWIRQDATGAWVASSWFAVHALPGHPGLPLKSWTPGRGIEILPAGRKEDLVRLFGGPAGPGWPPGVLASPDATETGMVDGRPVVRLHGVAVSAPLWAGLRDILALEGPDVMAGATAAGTPPRWRVSAPWLRVVVACVHE